MREAGLRAELDARSETLSRRVVEAHENGVPFFVTVGKREAESGSIAIRDRAGPQQPVPLEVGVRAIVSACEAPI
jgi:threonyl-tRNA synthetase